MSEAGSSWLRQARLALARLPSLRMGGIPDAPLLTVRDFWPGAPERGARLLKGALDCGGTEVALGPGAWADTGAAPPLRAAALGFAWLRDLRALGTDPARLRARALVGEFIGAQVADRVATRPDVVGTRLSAWLTNYEFFASSAEDGYRERLMARIAADARALASALPAEELDGRALTALKGMMAAAVALPESHGYMTRALRFLPQELARQIAADGSHCERSPATQMAALRDLIEIRALLQAGQATPPLALAGAIERAALALRLLRHGDGALALFNGSKEELASVVELVLAQTSRGLRPGGALPDGRFQRLQAGKSMLLVDAGAPPGRGLDRLAHAGTLSFEMSVGRERLIVNCGAPPPGAPAWHDALRATAAHSTLTIADTSSAELLPDGIGRRPERVSVQRQEANGAHWLEVSHDGWRRPFGAIHRRKLYMAGSGEDVRGEDSVEAATGMSFAVRFHLHPGVTTSLQQDGAALLRLPGGGGWRLRADGLPLALEESVYFGGDQPRRSEQVVLTGYRDGPQTVKWALGKVA
jgi:uncharacterized heparinase superfamily protein